MIRAGTFNLRLFDPEADAPDEIVRAIYEAMEEARLGPSSAFGAPHGEGS